MRIYISILFAAIAALSVVCFLPRDSTLGIELGGTLYSFQSPLDNFQYRRLIGHAVSGDAKALHKLVTFPCGGGAGCYDHGAVLVHVLMKVGDYEFAQMVGHLDKHAQLQLDGLLAAGFEYGLPTSVGPDESKIRFPMTAEAISQNRMAP